MSEKTEKIEEVVETDDDTLSDFVVIPTNKLDADQYSAEDLDGVTESVFGSGNMAYASLQASQTDGVISAADHPSDTSDTPEIITDRTNDTHDRIYTTEDSGGNFGSTVSSIGTSQLAADEGVFAAPESGLNLDSISFGASETKETPRSSQPNQTNTSNSIQSGGSGPIPQQQTTQNPPLPDNNPDNNTDITIINEGDTVITIDQSVLNDITEQITNNIQNVVVDISNVTTEITQILDQVTNIINNETIENLTDIVSIVEEVTNLVNTTSENITNLFENTTTQLTTLIDNASETIINNFDILTNLTQNTILDQAVTNLTQQTATVINEINTILDQSLDNSVTIVQDLSDTITNLTTTLETFVETVTTETINLSETLEKITNIITEPPSLPPLDILNLNNNPDTDLGLPASDILDIPSSLNLDPVEDVIGDVDILTNTGLDILGLNGSETDNAAGDSDLTVNLDTDILDLDIADINVDVNLDPLENIVGDIDLNIAGATDILGEAADSLIDGHDGGSLENNILSDVGDVLTDTTHTIVDAVSDSFEGIPILETITNTEDPLFDAGLSLDSGVTDISNALGDAVTLETPITDSIEDVIGDIGILGNSEENPLENILGFNGSETNTEVGNQDSSGIDINTIDDTPLNNLLDPIIDVVNSTTDLGSVLNDELVDNSIGDLNLGGNDDALNDLLTELDQSLEESVELLTNAGDNNILDMLSQGDQLMNWTESTISGDGGLFDDITQGNLTDGEILPDPIGAIGEGLSTLDVEPEINIVGGIGRLFG